MEKIFKAKRLDNGEWVEFNLNQLFDYSPLWFMELDEKTFCQYTGINDIQGNRIFEGDEVKNYKGNKCTVFFNERIQRTCLKYYDGSEFAAKAYVLEVLTLTGHNMHDKD